MNEYRRHQISITETKDLCEIDAQYFKDFTAMADDDVKELHEYLNAYLHVDKNILPDVSLSVTFNTKNIIKGITLSYEDIQSCATNVSKGEVWIVATLARKALFRTMHELQGNSIIIVENIQQHIEELNGLQEAICVEHDTEIPQSIVMEVH